MTRIQLIGILLILLEAKGNSGQSLARMKNVTMSREAIDERAGLNAVDGKYNRHAGSCKPACCAATTGSYPNWLEIDLGETNTFSHIVVYFPDDNTTYGHSFYIKFLDNMLTIRVGQVGPSFQTRGVITVQLRSHFSARYIRIIDYRRLHKVFVICEVDVFNDAIISRGRETSSSPTYSEWISALAVDGVNTTRGLGECRTCAGTVNETDTWFTVDLGDTFLVTLIRMRLGPDQRLDDSFEGMEIQLDGREIDTVPSTTYINTFGFHPVPEKIGRRVKLIFVGSNRTLNIREVFIYGERVISIEKQLSISTNYSDRDASGALDGDYRTLSDPNCCPASSLQNDPYLRLNLGNVHSVTRISIYGRTDGEIPYQNFEGMLIESNNSFTHNVTAQIKGQWINFYTFQLDTAELVNEITVTLPGVNRQLVVCELLVYGDCSDGYFGQGCSEQCHCEGLTCDTISGVCGSGTCKPGYIGPTCSEDCQESWYGQNCSEQCGHCKAGQTCNHISGYCSACSEGYNNTDPLCKTDCQESWYGQNCKEQCGHCKVGQTCNHITGSCNECKEGYNNTDPLCKTECLTGSFGFNCEHRCGMCAYKDWCDIYTGVCPSGCADGYKGNQCLQKIYVETYVSLLVYLGSLAGVTFILTPIAIILAIVLYRKRLHRSTQASGNSGHAPAIALQSLPNTQSNYEALQLDSIYENSAHRVLPNAQSNYEALQIDSIYVNNAHPVLPNTQSNYEALQLDSIYGNSAHPVLPKTQSKCNRNSLYVEV